MSEIKHVIFDLGGVLIDWNPRYLYQKIWEEEKKVDWFLSEICDSDWNEEQDAGRSLLEGTVIKIQEYPEHAEPIKAYYDRWEEMLGGVIQETVDIFEEIKSTGQHNLYALTNWSAETFPIAEARYPFLKKFEGIVVSGLEKNRKPFHSFYQLMLQRYDLDPQECAFIDDNMRNIQAAQELGIHAIHYINPILLRDKLSMLNILKN